MAPIPAPLSIEKLGHGQTICGLMYRSCLSFCTSLIIHLSHQVTAAKATNTPLGFHLTALGGKHTPFPIFGETTLERGIRTHTR